MKELAGEYFICNGEIKGKKEFDPSFLLSGMNVYEVLRQENGIGIFLEDHLQRLENSARGKKVSFNLINRDSEILIYDLCKRNRQDKGNIKIVIHKTADQPPDIYIYPVSHFYPEDKDYINGVRLICLAESRPDPNLKNWRPDFKKRVREIKEKEKVYEVILVNEEGFVTEGSQSNLFCIINNRIVTAPREKILPGITREYVIRICNENGLEVNERDYTMQELLQADAVFLTGTSPKILPVASIEKTAFLTSHPYLFKLADSYNRLIRDYILSKK